MDIIQSQVIQAGIKWIMGLLTPVGAFIKAAMAIIDVVKFFIQRAAQIMELVKAFTDSIKAIASGNVGAVAKSIENALGRVVPVLIGFLASLLGIGGLADKVLGVIRKIRQRIENAIVKFWSFVKGKAGKLLSKIGVGNKNKKGKAKKEKETRSQEEMKRDLHKGISAGTKLLKDESLDKKEIQKRLDALEETYDLKELKIVTTKVDKEGKETSHIEGEVNPKEKGVDVTRDLDNKELKYSIQKIAFVENEEYDIDKGEYPESARKQMQNFIGSIPKELINLKDNTLRKKMIRGIRKIWGIEKGAIYSPFVREYQKALGEMKKEIAGEYILTLETGGSLLGDAAIYGTKTRNEKISKAKEEHKTQQTKDLKRYIEKFMIGKENDKEVNIIIVETMVSGSSANNILNNSLGPIINKYSNANFKLLLMQETIGMDYKEKEKEVKSNEIVLNELAKANKVQVHFFKTTYTLGEDVAVQTEYNHKEPVILFNGSDDALVAYKINPTGDTTTRDIVIALGNGKFNGKLKGVL